MQRKMLPRSGLTKHQHRGGERRLARVVAGPASANDPKAAEVCPRVTDANMSEATRADERTEGGVRAFEQGNRALMPI